MSDIQEERFKELYVKYMPIMRVIANRKGIPYDEIDDVVQETFISYLAHYPLEWPDRKVRVTLVKILKNQCIDYFRKKSHQCMDFYDNAELEGLIAARSHDAFDVCVKKQEFQDVIEGLKTMRQDWQQIFVMYIIEGRTMSEISRELGVSEAACRMRLTRGRKYLAQYVKEKNEMTLLNKKPDSSLSGEPGMG